MKRGRTGALSVLSAIGGAATGVIVVGKQLSKRLTDKQRMSDKHLALFLMMNQWVKVKQEGKNLAAYFERNGYHNIAIYGMSYAGETLVEELKGSNIGIKYGIDKNADRIYANVDVVAPDSVLEEVDVVVVTSITFFDEVEQLLAEKIECPIVSLEDILYEV